MTPAASYAAPTPKRARTFPDTLRELLEDPEIAGSIASWLPSGDSFAIHDAARPNVSDELLDRILAAAATLPAVVPATAMTSTIKRIDPDAAIDAGEAGDALADSILGDAGRLAVPAHPVVDTVDRRTLQSAQTPQVFERELLMRAYAGEQHEGVTDDAEAVERLGETVHVVEGDPGNIKITTKRDLQLLVALMRIQPKARPAGDPFGLG